MSTEGIEGVRVLQRDVLQVIQSLSDEEWRQPSNCAGWRVQDVVAHMGSNFHATVEPPDAAPPPGPAILAEEAMELLVEPRRSWSPAQVLEEYEEFAPKALAVLEALQEEPTASTPLTLAELGTYPINLLADAYAFDHYCHLRVDILAPLGPIQRAVPAADDLRLVPTVGWMIAGLPQMCGAALTALDRPLRLTSTVPVVERGRSRPQTTTAVAISDAGDDVPVAATVRSNAHDFVIWGTARRNWRDYVTVDGDRNYAADVLDQLNIV